MNFTLDQIQDIVTEAKQAARNASQAYVDDWKAKTGLSSVYDRYVTS